MKLRLVLAAWAALFLAMAGPVAAQVQGGIKSIQVANNTTPVAVCNGPCTLTGITVFNNSSTIAYVKLYGTPAASVTTGTTVVTDRVMIPAATTGGAGAVIPLPGRTDSAGGVYYPGGLSVAVTTDYADSGTTAPAANTYIVNLYTR